MSVSKDTTYAYVTHRSNSLIKVTKKPIKLPAGDILITDGFRTVRTHCCNDVVIKPPTTRTVLNPPLFPSIPSNPPTITYPPTITDIPPTYTTHTVYEREVHQIAPVPEPNTLLLFGSGLCTLAALGRKKRK